MDLACKPPQFPATRWSIVLAASGGGQTARAALEELCRLYWFPLYAFARQWGCSPEDAEDETQTFLSRMAAEDLLAKAIPDRGKLRTYLLKIFQRDLIDAHRHAHRMKRGGGIQMVPLDKMDAEALFRETTLQSSPTATFDRLWALACLEASFRLLEHEYNQRGRGTLFASLRPCLDPESTSASDYPSLAAATGLEPNALRQAIFRLRQRFRALLCQTIADTLQNPNPAMIDEELSALRAALA